MPLREYQKIAVSKMKWGMTLPGNSVICLPTGSGKSHIIASFVSDIDLPVLLLCPSREILEQDLEKLRRVVPEEEIGVYSASMNTKDIKLYTIGTIQSVYKHPEQFTHYQVCLVDECHEISPKKLDGMYNQFFKAIGNPKVFGLTATPFRLDTFYNNPDGWRNYDGRFWQKKNLEVVTTIKMINRYKQMFWQRILYVINTEDLINQGYLVPLTYYDWSFVTHQDIPLNKSKSEFDLEAFEKLISEDEQKIVTRLASIDTKSMIVFCSSVTQAKRFSRAIKGSDYVSGDTPKKEREKTILSFRTGRIKTIFNVGVLTQGFDHPQLDAIAIIRPTKSLTLYNQMLGRGTRVAEEKDTCRVYDFVGNYKGIGSLESIKIVKLETGWNVISDTRPYGYHNKELYTFKIKNE